MNIFSRLLKLYRTNSFKTPLEDFTTEILVGILSQNQELLNAFVNDILKIEGAGFKISSQEHFLSDDGIQNCRVDVIIRNDEILCFLENKVNSLEGNEQLRRYSKVLDKYNTHYKTHLRYCTKYYDQKVIEEHGFSQLRWLDIARFLKKWNNVELIKEYLQFLKEHHMDNNTTFSAIDLIALENLNPLMQRMDAYLQKIKPSFEKQFGKIKDTNNVKQIKEQSRFVLIRERTFGIGYNQIGVGFGFESSPVLKVYVWSSQQNDKIKIFKESLCNPDIYMKLVTNKEDWIGLSKPISDFLSFGDRMEIEIETWFINAFKELKEFVIATPELEWDFS